MTVGNLSVATAAETWILKQGDFTVSEQALHEVLQARQFTPETLQGEKKRALLQELFLRGHFLAQQQVLTAEQNALLEKQLADYRKTLTSRMVLEALASKDLPDFTKRAEELYSVRQSTHYSLPLKLRVRVLEKKVEANTDEVRKHLEQIRLQVLAGQLDFKEAVKQFSDATDKTLTEGDSFWFDRRMKQADFYQAAANLSTEKPLSEVLVINGSAYLLYFLDRQEPRVQAFAEVKDQIINELKDEYLQAQRQVIVDDLREKFQSQTEIHPDYR